MTDETARSLRDEIAQVVLETYYDVIEPGEARLIADRIVALPAIATLAAARASAPLDAGLLARALGREFGKSGFFAPGATMDFLVQQARNILDDAMPEYARLAALAEEPR